MRNDLTQAGSKIKLRVTISRNNWTSSYLHSVMVTSALCCMTFFIYGSCFLSGILDLDLEIREREKKGKDFEERKTV